MTHVCEPCGEEFDTLSAKRLHQTDECPGQFDYIDAEDKPTDETVEETVEGLTTCQQCERQSEGPFTRGDDHTDAGYSVEIRFRCEHCGFSNVNTAILQGGRA
mgnify:CR=1 FL=1